MDNTKEFRACVIIYKGKEIPLKTQDAIMEKILRTCDVIEQANLIILNAVDISKILAAESIKNRVDQQQVCNLDEDLVKALKFIKIYLKDYIFDKTQYSTLPLRIIKEVVYDNNEEFTHHLKTIVDNVVDSKVMVRNNYINIDEEVIDIIKKTFDRFQL